MKRVPPSQRTREAIEELLSGELESTQDPKSTLVRLGVRRVVEEALEATVRELLGREYYERLDGGARGYRNTQAVDKQVQRTRVAGSGAAC